MALGLGVGCTPSDPNLLQGYVEAEYVHVSSPLGGTLETLAVRRGDEVKSGDLLFELEGEAERALLREAVQGLAQTRSRHEDLTKGQRPTELEATEARLAQAKASLTYAETEFKRAHGLYEQDVVSRAEYDLASATLDRERELVEELTSTLATAKLGGREDEIQAAAAAVAAAEATVARVKWQVDQKRQTAPTNALVFDTIYEPGEYVAQGVPVVSLLPPKNLKVRFFFPEPQLGRLRIGQTLDIHVDGVEQPYPARVSYISPQAEFTPPVIYSQETRGKLVFMVEARFESPDPTRHHPGQPVDVRLAGG